MSALTLDQAFQTAFAHHQAGQLAVAESLYRQILAVQPFDAETLHLLGVIATATGRYDEALRLIPQAIALQPTRPVFHSNLGVTLRRMGRFEEAAACLQRAVAFDPGLADAHMNLGDVLHELGRFEEAIASSRRALELRPDFAGACGNLGNSLAQLRRFDEAVECHRRAVALDPLSGDARNNLGNSLTETGQWEEAIACFRRALELTPDFPEAQANLGLAYVGQGRIEEAFACYREALASQPDLAGVHWNFALGLLLAGRFEEGWREHEWRWRYSGFPSPCRNFGPPQWDGSPVPGGTILLHAEQGHGDAIQFMRYVPLVRERAQAARVIVECPASLARLLAQSGGWNAEIVARQDWSGAALPPFDRHLPMLSLPLALRQFEPLPMAAPYLHADPALRAAWRERLPSGFRIGLAWAGSAVHRYDCRRSIPPEKLLPLLRVPGVKMFSLQLGATAPALADAGMIDLTAHIADFADTAALMAELDLIISVDTATAHLAGALGRSVWTLVPFVPDWRWGLGREDTPWYPSMRLFRQPAMGDWDSVIQRVAAELATMPR